MFQEIAPHQLKNQYTPRAPRQEDLLFCYREQQVLCSIREETLQLPTIGEAGVPSGLIYLLTIDETAVFLLPAGDSQTGQPVMQIGQAPARTGQLLTPGRGYAWHEIAQLRRLQPEWLAFTAVTASHLAFWYETHRFCGKCGQKLQLKTDERALVCPDCGLLLYPTISPVVIVGITDHDEKTGQDRILLTRYAAKHSKYNRYALVAGFVEIGEEFEDTIRREVMEEVALQVKDICYYKSQPWGFSNSILAGFFAEVDGNTQIRLDPDELSEGVWFTRDELPHDDQGLSLTWTMIEAFRAGKETNHGTD